MTDDNSPRSILAEAMEEVQAVLAEAMKEVGAPPIPQELLRQATDEAVQTPEGVEALRAAIGGEEDLRQEGLAMRRGEA